ncbi:MAG TPA: glycosyltransferase family A protein [Candidatus Paceibacterota bacterium]|jgi:cellulose synthase/poly-beta-1,6-N-acetylglucosamine synthase-like glycosyltransferase|nr:glycosyltransferase family A protein [Candidatus Paceibacterota bacterium]
MKISFSIPAYNEEARISRCLESVQKEIVRAGMENDMEIVVVNNASTDRTKEIASGFLGVRVIDEQRKGLTFARQAGLEHTIGELVANVDSDTMLPPGWLDTVMREFGRDKNLVALSGPFIYYDLPPFKRFVSSLFITMYPAVHFIVHNILRVGAILQGGNFVVRRDAMEKIGGFDTTIKFYGEDTDVARRISKVGRVKWTLSFPMYASGRRLAHEGMAMTAWRYASNFFSTTFVKRPWSEIYSDIRTDWRE